MNILNDLVIFSPVILLFIALFVINAPRAFWCLFGAHEYGRTMQSHGMVFNRGERGVTPVTRNFKKCSHCGKCKRA